MSNNNISKTLKLLMFHKDLKTAELARLVELPQQTVQRIVTGITPNPHKSSLVPLSEFFEVTIAQLKGEDTIPWLENIYTGPAGSAPVMKQVPVLAWSEIKSVVTSNKAIDNPAEQVFTDADVSARAFALRMNDSSMEPVYPQGTLLIFDPEKEVRDRRYVLVAKADCNEPLFRWLLVDGDTQYLKALSPDFNQFQMAKIEQSDVVCGILLQSRIDYS